MTDPILKARARRLAARSSVRATWANLDHLRLARSYGEYVDDKKSRGEKPLSQAEWSSRKSPSESAKPEGLKSAPQGSRIKHLLSKANSAMAKAWASSSTSVKTFLSDPVERKKMAKDMGASIKKAAPKAAKAMWKGFTGEVKAIFKDTPDILAAAAGRTPSVKVRRTNKKGVAKEVWMTAALLKADGKGGYTSDAKNIEVVKGEDGKAITQQKARKLNKTELHTLYGVGVYAAGTALSFSGASPLLAATAAGKAFGHSITLHAAFKAVHNVMDEFFLGVEAIESVSMAGGLNAAFGTGDIPGLNHLLDAVSSAAHTISKMGSDAEPTTDSEKFVQELMEKIYAETGKVLADFSDKDAEAVMQYGVGESGSKSAQKMADMSDQASRALMLLLSDIARRVGVAAHVYVVGGAVRNFVIDQPIKDIDVVIDSIAAGRDSEWFANVVAKAIPARTSVVTDQYGVAKVFVLSSWELAGHEMMDPAQAAVEIANARKESYGGAAGKGYKPDTVEPTTIEQDVLRREFTFNTLMWSLLELAKGPDKAEIVDLTGCGVQDLKDRRMQCPSDPDVTFSDDPSRMLRAVKFIVKYNMKLTPDTEAAIRRNLRKLRSAPYEAVAGILEDTLLRDWPTAKKALPVMKRLGLLDEIAGWIRENQSFLSRMEKWVSRKPMLFMFDLMDLGLPLDAQVSFLDAAQQVRLRQVALGMPEGQPEQLLAVLRQPGKAMDTRALMQEFGLQGRAVSDMQKGLAVRLLLDDPELAFNSQQFTNAVRRALQQGKQAHRKAQIMRGHKSGGSPLVQLNIALPGGDGSKLEKIIPSNSVPYLIDNVQAMKLAARYQERLRIRKQADDGHRLMTEYVTRFLAFMTTLERHTAQGWATSSTLWSDWFFFFKSGLAWSTYVTENLEVPPKAAKGLELASRLFHVTHGRGKGPRNGYQGWLEKNLKSFTLLREAIKWPKRTEGGNAILEVGPFRVHNVLGLDGRDLETVKQNMLRSAKAIQQVGLTGLPQMAHIDVFLVGEIKGRRTAAWYYPAKDIVYYRAKMRGVSPLELSRVLIHEIGHRFFLKKLGATQKQNWALYHFQLSSPEAFEMPKEGDVLPPQFRVNNKQVQVAEFRDGLVVLNDASNGTRLTSVDRAKFYKWVRQIKVIDQYPSMYAATDAEEHFCEALSFKAVGGLAPANEAAFDRIILEGQPAEETVNLRLAGITLDDILAWEV